MKFQPLRITKEINQRILTPAEKKRHTQMVYHELELPYLSSITKRDLLKYARNLNIHMGSKFSLPVRILGPHLRQFEILDGTHTWVMPHYGVTSTTRISRGSVPAW